MSEAISFEKWFAELRTAQLKVDDGFLSRADITKLLGIGDRKARALLLEAKRRDKLQVIWVTVEDVSGRLNKSPRYKIVGEKGP